MIEKLIGYGVFYIWIYVNIDFYVELENFWGVKRVLEKYVYVIDYDIVVFLQYGLLKNFYMVLFMREVLKNGGIMVGGLDFVGIDYVIEEFLEIIFDLVEEF